MQRKKCFATLGVLRRKVLDYGRRGVLRGRVLGYGRRGAALTIVIATLTLARGASGFQLGGEPDRAGAYNVLHLFTWAKYPTGNLIFDAAGNLYGTTQYDTDYGYGVVFKLSPSSSGWSETVLHTFLGFGAYPTAPVIFDRAGNLYGTTSNGNNAFDYGLVFEITR